MNRNEYLKMIYMKAKRRGMVELDLFFGNFVDNDLKHLTDKELYIFESLLNIEDSTLYKWLINNSLVEDYYKVTWHKITGSQKNR